jgi:hypothetical protein
MIALAFFFFAADADQIMVRVAENQNRAQAERSAFVYHQNVLVRIKRSNGKLAREEYSEFDVAPTADRTHRNRTLFRGKYVDGRKEVPFETPGFQHKGLDIDAGLAEGLSDSFGNDGKSRDGIERDLFPLTSRQQRSYNFRLEGEEEYQGYPVYRITFKPKPGDNDFNWQGEVLVHRGEFQPVLVTAFLATKIPVLVKTMLGTDIKQLGFKVTYKKFDESLWFPVSYGGEFQLKALFLYGRKVGLSMQNSNFQRAQVVSKVSFEKATEP